jgi:hypothetical protein
MTTPTPSKLAPHSSSGAARRLVLTARREARVEAPVVEDPADRAEVAGIIDRLRVLWAAEAVARSKVAPTADAVVVATAEREGAGRVVAKRRGLSAGAPAMLADALAALDRATKVEADALAAVAALDAELATLAAETATLGQRRAELVAKLNPTRRP